MANDKFIEQMMVETLQESTTHHTRFDFNIRRDLSLMGVKYNVGEWLQRDIARFVDKGQVIDIPLLHKEISSLNSKAMASALSVWNGEEVSHFMLLTTHDQRPWIVMWNQKERQVSSRDVISLFEEKSKAA